ncbi:MAG: RNase adapter RapZ [Firmicutes bacterium]|nr:RNase adapter RapZ [Bacillota bacterium]
MQFLLITGLSGAGKTETVRILEDMGFFCVDNLPPALIPKFAELCAQSEGKIKHIALVCDIRGRGFFDHLIAVLEELEERGFLYDILFLEASNETLIRRFKESRRRHPLAPEGTILEGIAKERQRLRELKRRAHRVLDTSQLSPRELREEMIRWLDDSGTRSDLAVSVISFGFKHGLPLDADLAVDVRFLPNPFWVEALAPLTGNDAPVRDYVLQRTVTQKFLAKYLDLIEFLLPEYVKEGKQELVIAIGCTGGQHRSVALANHVADFIRNQGFVVYVEHRGLQNQTS